MARKMYSVVQQKLGIIYVRLSHINWILKLKILTRKIFRMMSVYNRKLYTLLLNIKARNKVYNRMSTEALTVILYWPCSEVFMTNHFLHNDCTFNRKRARWEEGPNNPNVCYL